MMSIKNLHWNSNKLWHLWWFKTFVKKTVWQHLGQDGDDKQLLPYRLYKPKIMLKIPKVSKACHDNVNFKNLLFVYTCVNISI
jgi:hypothetical protein